MLTVISCPVELRGIADKVTKKGSTYYVVNFEIDDGTPYAMYCPDSSAFPVGLKKGDMVTLTMEVKVYNGNERLIVRRLDKVDAE